MNQEQKPIFSFALNWAFIIALVTIALSLVFYFTGLQQNKIVGIFSFVVYVLVMFFAQKAYRDQNPGISISYGRSLLVGFVTGALATVILVIYNYAFFKFIAPDVLTKMIEEAQLRVIEMDLPADVEANAIEGQQKFMQPGWLAIFSLFGTLFQSLLAALIGAIFAKGTSMPDAEELESLSNEE